MVDSTLIAGRKVGQPSRQIVGDGAARSPANVSIDPLECLVRAEQIVQGSWNVESRSHLAHAARVLSLGALTASIVHEISQPLSAININASTFLRLLAADPPDIEAARETARLIVRDGRRASDVVTSLRALFTRSDPVTELVDLNEAARGVISLLPAEFQRTAVVLQLELLDPLPQVLGDSAQMQQVILNLISNALDAMRGVEGRQRELTIRTDHADDRVRFCVRDVGIGIGDQGADRLFDPFHTTKINGMGIGLAVSRSIVEGHGGKLVATSNDGPGATFSFSIPAALSPRPMTGTKYRSGPDRFVEPVILSPIRTQLCASR